MAPNATPATAAKLSPMIQLPPPIFMRPRATTYCTTDAATANEMSMPPAISTTTRPTAKIRLVELVLRRLKRLAIVKNLSLVSVKPRQITSRTISSQVSVGLARNSFGILRLGIDRGLQIAEGDG